MTDTRAVQCMSTTTDYLLEPIWHGIIYPCRVWRDETVDFFPLSAFPLRTILAPPILSRESGCVMEVVGKCLEKIKRNILFELNEVHGNFRRVFFKHFRALH